ncbi:hypothetical protein, partial [Nocardia sp. NPDC058497]|uniref:hypothetical protein n=1 Tax=Nocardia sp. NPDC058497 TaxID=3346529 RepID=UPI003655A73C
MREQQRQARILKYWRAVEYFSPPRVDAVDFGKGVRNVDGSRPLPWEPGAPALHPPLRRNFVWQHTVYIGVFDLAKVRAVLDATLRVTEEELDLDARTGGQSALLSLTVNGDGLLIRDSVTVSSCAWAVGRTVDPGPASDEWLLGFDADQDDIRAVAFGIGDGRVPLTEAATRSGLGRIAGTAVRIAVDTATGGVASALAGVVSPLMEPLVAQLVAGVGARAADVAGGPEAGAQDSDADRSTPPTLGVKALTTEDLGALTRWVAEHLGVAEVLSPAIIRIKSYPVHERSADAAGTDEFLNSFFADDLERVAADIERGGAGRALDSYLLEDERIDQRERIDVRRQPADILRSLSPRSMPPARWPAKLAHTLTLSQQFAVNEIYRTLGAPDDRGMFAVNGPPGTGKTTLLRDLIAAIVVERAIRLARLDHPRQAFRDTPLTWRTGETGSRDGRRLFPLIDELCGYEVVVASSNNGAVENITMEVPAADSVDTEAFPQSNYLGDQATLLVGKPAWGAIAARLGKRSFRAEFVERFWWGEGADTEEGEAGLSDLLKEFADYTAAGEQLEGILSWEEAVEEFDKAMDAVQRLARARQYIADIVERDFDADPELLRLRRDATGQASYVARVRRHAVVVADEMRAAEQAWADASTSLALARRGLAGADAAVEYATRVVLAAESVVRDHDRQRPGFLRRLLSWNSDDVWEAERTPLISRLAVADQRLADQESLRGDHRAEVHTRQRALDEAARVMHQAQARVRGVERELADALAASEQAGAAVQHREAVLRRDAEALETARMLWSTTVPRAEMASRVYTTPSPPYRNKTLITGER